MVERVKYCNSQNVYYFANKKFLLVEHLRIIFKLNFMKRIITNFEKMKASPKVALPGLDQDMPITVD